MPSNTNVTIKCETLQPQQMVRWLRNGRQLDVTSKCYTIESTPDNRQHMLTINLIRPDDAGEYGVSIGEEYIPVTRLNIVHEEMSNLLEETVVEDTEPQVGLLSMFKITT